MTDFHYTFESGRTFEDAIASVLAAVPANGYRVLHVHDVQATFKEKGVEREPYSIIEVCNVKNASKALKAEPLTGLMMPCKICVFTDGGKTMVSLLKPGLLATFFPGAGLEEMAKEVEADLIRVAGVAR